MMHLLLFLGSCRSCQKERENFETRFASSGDFLEAARKAEEYNRYV